MALTNKVIVVIGGNGLLGSGIVRECLQEGARVIIADIKDKETPENAVFIKCDATDEVQVKTLAQKVQTDFGRVDGVVNATYPSDTKATQNKTFESGDMDDMLHNMSLHLRTCFLTVRSFSPIFKKQKNGSFVFFASIYGVSVPRFEMYEGLPMTQPAEYAAAKGGIIAVTRYFASLLGKDGIRVNTISPGGISANQPQSFVDAYSKKLLLGSGLLEPKHVSGVTVFLLSDASAMMTGQNLVIDGGWTL